MSERPPLAILLVSADPARLRAALTLARAEVALGSGAKIFLQGEAATLLRQPITDGRDADWEATGEPNLEHLLSAALADGVEVSLCESGLTMAGLDPEEIDGRIEVSGPIRFLAEVGPDMRLVTL